MKRKQLFFALMLFLAFPLPIFSQGIWFENGATWVHTVSNDLGFGYIETKVDGDSVINGQPCKKLTRHYKIYDDLGNPFIEDTANDLFVYADSDGKKTYIYNNNLGNFELLYDMSKVAGQTVSYPYPLQSSLITLCPDNNYSVIDNGDMIISGQSVKYYTIEPTPTSNYIVAGKILERIGSDTHYFFSVVGEDPSNPALCPIGQMSMNFAGYFRCYHDNTIDYKDSVVQNNFGGNCYFPGISPQLSVKETDTSKNDFILYPNPVDKILKIRRNEGSNTTAKITNRAGQLMKSYEIHDNKAEINVSSLPAGIYFITIDGNTKKMIVAHQ